MPRLVHKPPSYSHHKPTGQARVRYQGKDHYLGAYGSPESKEAYARFISQIPKQTEEPAALPSLPSCNPTVRELVLRYYEHSKDYYVKNGSPTGEHITIRCSLRPLKQHFGELSAKEFGPRRLKELQGHMITRGWSRNYINKATGIVRRCFTWCASEEMIPSAVALALKTVQGLQKGRTAARETSGVQPVSDEAIDATLPHVSALIADIIKVMRLTGCRPGEVLNMKAEDIDRSDPECWRFELKDHKTAHHDGKTRTIFLGPRAQEVILPRLVKAAEDGRLFPMTRCALLTGVKRGCRRAFPHPILKWDERNKMTAEQKAELKAWNKAHAWHPNRIRHSVGTEVRAKFGLEAAQCYLGHSRADVTQTYAERDERRAAEVARKIG